MAPERSTSGGTPPRDPGLALPVADRAGWSALDVRAVDTVRVLAADAVQKTGNGHPGTAMSLAPLAYLLFQQVMRHDPADDQWLGRDRFVLSCGHTSLTLYIQLYLAGYGLEMEDLEALRTWGSATPGHPEYRHTRGVEITTGPLGQGLGAAVGMAMAARRERGLLDPEAAPGASPFDHHVYVLASDGDMMEGVASEASSLAGHQQLGNLVVFYDSNHISIEDDTDISFSEDVPARYAAYGWHVQTVDWTRTGDYVEDVDALLAAVEAAKADRSRPSLIMLRTIIGWPAPTKRNTGKAHGAALGDDEVAGTKRLLGFDPESFFPVEDEVLAHTRAVGERGRAARERWQRTYEAWRTGNPRAPPCSTGCGDRTSPTAGPTPCRSSRPTPRAWPPARRPARYSPPSHRCCPNCGADRRTSRAATTPPWTESPPSSPPTGRPRSSAAAPTGARCTSASGSTRWAPCSTASACRA